MKKIKKAILDLEKNNFDTCACIDLHDSVRSQEYFIIFCNKLLANKCLPKNFKLLLHSNFFSEEEELFKPFIQVMQDHKNLPEGFYLDLSANRFNDKTAASIFIALLLNNSLPKNFTIKFDFNYISENCIKLLTLFIASQYLPDCFNIHLSLNEDLSDEARNSLIQAIKLCTKKINIYTYDPLIKKEVDAHNQFMNTLPILAMHDLYKNLFNNTNHSYGGPENPDAIPLMIASQFQSYKT